jgi:hypothetical protein
VCPALDGGVPSCIPANPCHAGTLDCATLQCTDLGPQPDGSPCGNGNRCVGDVCKPCVDGTACTPIDGQGRINACDVGVMDCSTGCVDKGSVPDLTPCAGGVCCSAFCTAARVCAVTLASGQNHPWGIGVDSSNVYWANTGDGSLARVSLAGGSPVTLARSGSGRSVVVDAANVYWTSCDGCGAGTLQRLALGGGTPATLATGSPMGLALGGSSLYWADGSSVLTMPASGGVATTIATGQYVPLAVAVDSANVYWSDNGGSAIMTMPIGGVTPTTLVSGTLGPSNVALNATSVFWISGEGSIVSVPLGGGFPSTLASRLRSPCDLTVDDAFVYWTDVVDGTISRVRVGGGPATVLLGQQPYAWAITMDATSVYWTSQTNGTVSKFLKP